MKKIGFLGCGNMGGALACAISKFDKAEIYLFDKDEEKMLRLADKTHGIATDINGVLNTDILFLGLKPNIILDLLATVKDRLNQSTVIVSMAAGVKIESIKKIADKNDIIRIMPNTPVAYGEGVVLFSTSGFCDERLEFFKEAMSLAGMLDEIPETDIDAATAVSGCGPAFVYMFIDALAAGGVAAGLTHEKALMYAAQTVIGAGVTALKSDMTPEELRIAVCSPGGSTIEGVKSLWNDDMKKIVSNAVCASFEKTKTLGK